LVVIVVKNVLKSFFLDNDSYFLNTAVKIAEFKLSRVVNVKEFELFDQKGLFAGKGVGFKLNLELELVLKTRNEC